MKPIINNNSSTTTNFTNQIWNAIDPLYKKIIAHPFIQKLGDGTLPEEIFKFYIIQDALFLRDYFRGMALLAGRSEDFPEGLTIFSKQASGIADLERDLHDRFFKHWNFDASFLDKTELTPYGLLYTSYLLSTVELNSYTESLGAFLPCMWIYAKVGEFLTQKGSPNPLYQDWINTYASPDFNNTLKEVIRHVDDVGQSLSSEEERRSMIYYAFKTTQMEYLFWEAAYQRQEW